MDILSLNDGSTQKGHQSFLGANFRVWFYCLTKNILRSIPAFWVVFCRIVEI